LFDRSGIFFDGAVIARRSDEAIQRVSDAVLDCFPWLSPRSNDEASQGREKA